MRKLAFLGIAVLCASVAFGAVTDNAPGVPEATTVAGPIDYNPAFGSLIRSWAINLPYPGGLATHHDGYISVARWPNTYFTQWSVYTTTGSLVKTVSVTGGRYNGCRDGEGRSHLGSGYFVTAQENGGINRWTYTSGGTPGSSGTAIFTTARGRSVSWDGTYYVATQGAYQTPLGVYTTAGSLVRTIPGSQSAPLYPKYGNAARAGYILSLRYNYGCYEVNPTTGSVTRSFATGTAFAAGASIDYDNNPYLYITDQAATGRILCFDVGSTGVAPVSLGKIKSLYR